MKKETQQSANRRNVYFRNPIIFDAFQMAIEKGIISAKSASERLEQLIAGEMRRVAPKMRANNLSVPVEVFKK